MEETIVEPRPRPLSYAEMVASFAPTKKDNEDLQNPVSSLISIYKFQDYVRLKYFTKDFQQIKHPSSAPKEGIK